MNPWVLEICPYFKERFCESGFSTKTRRDLFLHGDVHYCSELFCTSPNLSINSDGEERGFIEFEWSKRGHFISHILDSNLH